MNRIDLKTSCGRNLTLVNIPTSNYSFYSFTNCFFLQLEPQKNLVDQCVQGEGLVQINVELVETEQDKRINIVDVLKPTEEYLQRRKFKLYALVYKCLMMK